MTRIHSKVKGKTLNYFQISTQSYLVHTINTYMETIIIHLNINSW